ncbi:mCG1050279, partial [Mus musculus]
GGAGRRWPADGGAGPNRSGAAPTSRGGKPGRRIAWGARWRRTELAWAPTPQVSPAVGTPVRFPLEPAPRVTGLALPWAARRPRTVGGDGTRVRTHGRAGGLCSMRRDARFR